jgi:hypothetical protein
VEFLRTRSALQLVIDNFEHVAAAGRGLGADILGGVRGVGVIATIRQPLGGE